VRHRTGWTMLAIVLFPVLGAAAVEAGAKGTGGAAMDVENFDRRIVDEHKQLFDSSCVPMTVELVLKLTGRKPVDFFKLQEAWKNKTDGSFGDFDEKTLAGLTFHRQFTHPRGNDFPLNRLFATIDRELDAGRYVIVSFQSGAHSWHMHVIYGKSADGEFVAITKSGSKASGARTIVVKNVKEIVRKMKGTDILTYEVRRPLRSRNGRAQ
jgi:hypothetical protein